MNDVAEKLRALNLRANADAEDRANYAAYIKDRRENGGWTDADVAEFQEAIRATMNGDDEDDKAAAREFLAAMAAPAKEFSARIRAFEASVHAEAALRKRKAA